MNSPPSGGFQQREHLVMVDSFPLLVLFPLPLSLGGLDLDSELDGGGDRLVAMWRRRAILHRCRVRDYCGGVLGVSDVVLA